jgi:hypothetical protein
MIQVDSKETYMLYFPEELANTTFQLTGRELFEAVAYQRANIKDIYAALERAVESGDNLQIGIVIGQILNKLKDATRPS